MWILSWNQSQHVNFGLFQTVIASLAGKPPMQTPWTRSSMAVLAISPPGVEVPVIHSKKKINKQQFICSWPLVWVTVSHSLMENNKVQEGQSLWVFVGGQADLSGCLMRSFSPPGLLMNLKYYVSPYDLFEDGTGAPVVLHENNGRWAVELLLLLEGGKEAEFQPVQQDNPRPSNGTLNPHGFN